MNLTDYHKIARTLFADAEDLEKFIELLAQCWESGKRSGAAGTVERRASKCLVGEWDWDSIAVIDDLGAYVDQHSPDGLFSSKLDQAQFILEQLEDMRVWAVARGERKLDWSAALKGWMRRSWGSKSRVALPRQADLFAGSSPRPSAVLSREQEYESVHQRAMSLNEPIGPAQPSPISRATESGGTHSVSLRLLPTPHQSQ